MKQFSTALVPSARRRRRARLTFIAVLGALALSVVGVAPVHAMQIFITVSGPGTTIALDVEPSDSIENVKAKITDAAGYAPEDQHLFYDGAELDDGFTLADYGIQKDETLTLTVDAPVAAPAVPGRTLVVPGERSFTLTPVAGAGGGPVDSFLVEVLASGGAVVGSCTVLTASGAGTSCRVASLDPAQGYRVRTTATGAGGSAVEVVAPSDPVVHPLAPVPPTPVDTDGDGLSDEVEVRGIDLASKVRRPGRRFTPIGVVRTNPQKADTDGDGIDDAAEVRGTRVPTKVRTRSGRYVIGLVRTDPTRADTDRDGLSDRAEVSRSSKARNGRPRSNPLNWDTDFGGASDGREVENRTDPTVVHR